MGPLLRAKGTFFSDIGKAQQMPERSDETNDLSDPDLYPKRDSQTIRFIILLVSLSFTLIVFLILYSHRGQLLLAEHAREMGSLSENTAVIAGVSQRIALLQYGLLGKRATQLEEKLENELLRETQNLSQIQSSFHKKLSTSTIVSPETVSKASELSTTIGDFLESSVTFSGPDMESGDTLRFADLTTRVISLAGVTQRMISEDAVQSALKEEALLEQLKKITIIVIVAVGLMVICLVSWKLSVEFAKRRRSETELAKTNQELEKFSAIVAHDLRGPLNNLNLSAQMLAGETLDLATAKKQLVPIITTETMRLREMVSALLQLSRTGSTKISLRRIRLSEIVQAVRTGMQLQIESLKVKIMVNHDSWIRVDPSLFQNVIQNLIENSLKYKRPDVDPTITLSSQSRRDGWQEIIYEDNGKGIAEELRERVFEPFFQSDREKEGLGLGLSVIKKILRMHDASISIQDKNGPGTKFVIRVPNLRMNW